MIPVNLRSYFFLGLLLASIILVFFIFKPFLIPLAFAATFAVVLQPLYQALVRSMRRWPGFAALLTILITLVCIVVPISILVGQIAGEASRLYVTLSTQSVAQGATHIVEIAVQFIRDYVPGMSSFSPDIAATVNGYSRAILIWISNNLGVAFSSLVTLALDFLIFSIALYYFLKDGPALKKQLIQLSPLEDSDDEIIFTRLELAVNSVIKGSIVVAIVQGLVAAIGFLIFGLPNAVLWGTLAAFTALIPGLGTSLVVIPSILYLFIVGNTLQAAGLLVWGLFAVGLIDNFLGPKLLSRGTQLHPFAILLSVLGGIAFFGPAGVFVGPLCISLLFALLHIYSQLSTR